MFYGAGYQQPSYNINPVGGTGNMYNPLQPQMERLNSMQNAYGAQQQNQFQQQIPQQQVQQPQHAVLPVSGIEEVRAHPTDMSGNLNYFIDNANKRIYTKQLNVMGVPEINTYTLNNEVVKESNKQVDYNIGEKLEKRINDLEYKIANYENMFLGGGQNVQSSNDNTNDARGQN